jgi:hypothetical protein
MQSCQLAAFDSVDITPTNIPETPPLALIPDDDPASRAGRQLGSSNILAADREPN